MSLTDVRANIDATIDEAMITENMKVFDQEEKEKLLYLLKKKGAC